MNLRALCVLVTLLACLVVPPASAQRLTIARTDTSRYPELHTFVYVLDRSGQPITGLSASDFTISENGSLRQVVSVDCPPSKRPEAISSVLTIDVSGSMASSVMGTPDNPNILLARAAASAWVAALPDGSECAVTSFDDRSLIQHDFTADKSVLNRAIMMLQPNGGTNYNAGFVDKAAGALSIAEGGKHKRIVVFLTDGLGGGNENAIVEEASKLDATIFCVTLGMPAPAVLKNIAQRTGGDFYENVTSVDDALAIYQAILYQSLGGNPCELVWRSEPGCASIRSITVAVPSRSLSTGQSFTTPFSGLPSLVSSPATATFGVVPTGEKRDVSVKITAANRSVTVTGIEAVGKQSGFTFDPVATPFTLLAGESRTLTIRFTAPDTTYRFAHWVLRSDACTGSAIYAAAGSRVVVAPTIRVVYPNGGETLKAGEIANVQWDGIPAADTVRLEYSTDAGSTWRSVAQKTNGLAFDWKVPATPSKRCLMRVKQLGDAATGPTIKLDSIQVFAISPDGTEVAGTIGKKNDPITIWNIEDGKQLRTLPNAFPHLDGMNDMVKTLEYSPDGRSLLAQMHGGKTFLLEATSGRIVRTFNGALLTNLNSKNAADNGSAFSPDGTRVLIQAGADYSVEVWDLRSGRKISTLRTDNSNLPYTAIFTPDGKEVITTGKDRVAHIWNASNGALVRTLRSNTDIGAVATSPDGTIVATSTNYYKDTLRLFSQSSGELIASMPMGGGEHVPQFSPDGLYMVLWPNDIPTLADVRTGTPIRELKPETNARTRRSISYATFSSDGSLVATYGGTGILVWDVRTGVLVTEFPHKGNYIGMSARFTPNGSAMVWCFGEYIEIGYVQPTAIQSDVSDNLWTIVVDARAAVVDVDFGQRTVGTTTDSLVRGFVRNTGSSTLHVDAITIGGANASDFTLVSGIPPFDIAPGAIHPVEFSFTPSTTGARTASAAVDAGGAITAANLRGEGVRSQLKLETEAIDFSETLVGSQHDTTVNVVLTNLGTTSIDVRSSQLIGPDTSQFAIMSGGDAFTLAPRQSRTMALRFSPTAVGRTSTQLAFAHNGRGPAVRAYLFGEGILPGEQEHYTDPTTFRTIAAPNAIIPKKGTIVTGVYDVFGVMAGYAITDNIMLLGGGGIPLPDDWGGVNGSMYGAYSIGVKGGMALTDKLNMALGFQFGRSIYDQDITPDVTESVITANVPYGSISYGDDDSRVSATFGYAFKHHDTPGEQFDRQAGIISIGGDYRFAERWKVVVEGLSMKTMGYIPLVATARYFGHTWAIDAGLAYVGIGDGPSLKVAPIVSWVAVW